jgi:transcriptional regulator with XRE-family HTH domain
LTVGDRWSTLAGRPAGRAELNRDERAARDAARRQRTLALAARLRVLRHFRGWTQGQLGQEAGVSRQYVSGLEKGKRPRPRGETLERLATALGVDVDQLLGRAPLPELGAVAPEAPPTPEGPLGPGWRADVEGQTAPGELVPMDTVQPGDLPAGPALAIIPGGPYVQISQQRLPDGSLLIYLRGPNGPPKPPG